MSAFFRRFMPSTLVEWTVVVAIVAVLIALLSPSVPWAGSGSRVMPVLIDVFDAASGQPIIGAKVTLMPGLSAFPEIEYRDQFSLDIHDFESDRIQHGVTNEAGRVHLDHDFPTSSGRSGNWVQLSRAWVCVTAQGYGGIVVPVRYESVRREQVVIAGRSQEVFVAIGMFPLTQGERPADQAKQPLNIE